MTQQREASRKGRAAEHAVMAWLLANNDLWATQMSDASSVDLLIAVGRRTWRVQVKAVFQIDGRPTINLTKHGNRRYEEHELDYVIAVDMNALLFWVLPHSITSKFGRLRLGKAYSGYAYQWWQGTPEFRERGNKVAKTKQSGEAV